MKNNVTTQIKQTKTYLAPLILFSSNLFFATNFTLVKLFSLSVPLHTIMLFRFLAGPVFLIPYFVLVRKKIRIKSYKLFAVRIFFGVSAMTCLFLAFKYGDIGKSMLIFECATIWTLLYGYMVYKHKPHIYSLLAMPIAFIGIYLVLQIQNITVFQLGDMFALCGSLLNTGVYISLKNLRDNHDTTTIVLVTYFFSTIILLVPNIVSFPLLNGPSVLGLCIMCSIGFVGQCGMTLGFKFATAGVSSLLMLSIIPLTTLSGICIFNETYTSMVWVGMVLITMALLIISKWQ